MMFKTLIILASAAVLVFAHDEEIVNNATALIQGKGLKGYVVFSTQPDGNLHITGKIAGLPEGKYGFIVYDKGDITKGCNLKGHFNPNGQHHGHADHDHRPVGDLGNLHFDINKVANIDFVDKQAKLTGHHNIIGRAIVLHEGPNDHTKDGHSNAGTGIACGVIGIM